jgi:GNAT superfamily N-acetyltransferase
METSWVAYGGGPATVFCSWNYSRLALRAGAEAEARRRGLIGMWLTTWTFQAPEFYRKLGFEECGRISGFPPGHDHITYVKRFATST